MINITLKNTFTTSFENKVKETILKYNLLTKNEKTLVAVSGGKDSSTALYILKRFGYNIEAITVDVLIGKYTKKNLENIKGFCNELGVKLHIVSFRESFGYSLCYISSVLKSKGYNYKSCTVCGVLRRYLINKEVKKLRANKVVTGHNIDDEAQSFMMNLFKGNPEQSMRLGPVTGVIENSGFVKRVKPLYFCTENEIIKYSKLRRFNVDYGRCPCCYDSFRNSVRRELIALNARYSNVNLNIVNYFLNIKKKDIKITEKINHCKECGEPARDETCRVCLILGEFRSPDNKNYL